MKTDHQKENIEIVGARTHNLKNVSVSIPRDKFIVVTGVSGSGKSSLTIDTLFAEGQRRYAESLSAYARQFMSRMAKPDVDYIKGLCPAIAIEQKVSARTPRSTVGSMTEIYDYLRLLFARTGRTFSPISGREVKKDEVQDILYHILSFPDGTKIMLLALFKTHTKRDTKEELGILVQKGFSRLYGIYKDESGGIDRSEMMQIEDLVELDTENLNQQLPFHNPLFHAYILVDRLVKKEYDEEEQHRVSDSITTSLYEGEGEMYIETNKDKIYTYSNRFELDGMAFEQPSPNLFSYNNPYGACPQCEGFGQALGIDEDLVIPDKRLSLYDGAIAPWKGEKLGEWKNRFVLAVAKEGFPIHKPIMDLTAEQYRLLWEGRPGLPALNDFFREVEESVHKVQYRVLLSRFRGKTKCPSCKGYRLRKEALCVLIGGMHIGHLAGMPVKYLKTWLEKLEQTEFEKGVSKRLMAELHQRLQTLLDVGLGYLTLDRTANTLSGGESQRIQLTRSLGSNLTNSLYILDEPSIGLHPRDTENLIGVLQSLRNLGNTVVVVEHDEMMMRKADHIIDMGPLASHLGGEVVAEGDYEHIISNTKSLTGKYLRGDLNVGVEKSGLGRPFRTGITVHGAKQNNLRDVTVTFPLRLLCAVSGVSGSGKTTLVKQILYPGLRKLRGEAFEKVGLHASISGDWESLSQIELIDQNPIGKSSRSNPVTYIKAYDEIRDFYARQPMSKMKGFMPKHFSFNVEGGRCDSCNGEGEQVVSMQFLADVHLVCETCKGKRFKEEVLEVTVNGVSISDLLDMSVDSAIDFFSNMKGKEALAIAKAMKPLQDVGLGYVKLGQSSDTLSGGEAQRIKLASFLGRGKNAGSILFIFDEPTTGLHFHDINKLLASFEALIENGHSIIVIEHNTDVLKAADWIIDLGPEAGDGGGNLVYAGHPNGLREVVESRTGPFM